MVVGCEGAVEREEFGEDGFEGGVGFDKDSVLTPAPLLIKGEEIFWREEDVMLVAANGSG